MAKLSVTKPQSMCLSFFHLYNKKHVLGKTVHGHHECTLFLPQSGLVIPECVRCEARGHLDGAGHTGWVELGSPQ